MAAFQTEHGLHPDGLAGPITLRAVADALDAVVTPDPTPAPTPPEPDQGTDDTDTDTDRDTGPAPATGSGPQRPVGADIDPLPPWTPALITAVVMLLLGAAVAVALGLTVPARLDVLSMLRERANQNLLSLD